MLLHFTEAHKSFLNITDGCICPGHTLTLECTVSLARSTQGGETVWKGSGTTFDCNNTHNEIVLLHSQFVSTGPGVARMCNNGSIQAQSLRVNSENTTYTSQFNITVSSDIIDQNITCQYDDVSSQITTIQVLKLTQKVHV